MKDRLRSLRMRLVAYVFFIMVFSSLITGALYLVAMRTPLGRTRVLFSQLSPVWLAMVSSVVGTLITAWIGKYYLSPVRQLIAATARVAKGDFSVRLPENENSEMNDLIHSFNSMAEELGSIEMFRTDFINSFSHEFKTPIVSIRGFARQLERDDITEEERKEYAHIIAREAERLANLSTNILTLTRLENQRMVTERKIFRLDEMLREVVLLLQKQWDEKQLEMVIELEETLLSGNEEMLSQAFVNLVSNAVKFTPDHGTVRVTLENRGRAAVVRVEDTGVGIREEAQAHVFEKFYQGETSHHAEGNGLGLALVKRIVELHRGTVGVQSTEGKGSCFTVTLPARDEGLAET